MKWLLLAVFLSGCVEDRRSEIERMAADKAACQKLGGKPEYTIGILSGEIRGITCKL